MKQEFSKIQISIALITDNDMQFDELIFRCDGFGVVLFALYPN